MAFRGTVFRGLALAASCLLLPAVAGCGGGDAAQGRGPTLHVGVTLSLTGQFSQESRQTRNGYLLCERRVNARGGVPVGARRARLALHIQDDASRPDLAASIVDQFDEKGYRLVLGPYGSPVTAAVAAVTERNRQVLVNTLGAEDAISGRGNRRTFTVISPASEYATSILAAVHELARPRPARVMFLSADDGFARAVTRSGQETARRLGLRVLPAQYFRSGATDVSAALIRARQARPDLIIGAVHFVEGVALVRQSRELGLDRTPIALTVAATTADFTRALRGFAEGVIGVSQWVKGGRDAWFGDAKDYSAAYRRMYGEEPQYHPAAASAACLALVLAVQGAGSTDADAVRTALETLDEQSFFGRIRFDSTGRNVFKHMTVIQVQRGRSVQVWPARSAAGGLVWPGAR
ncbi:amino acid ABC transporter substrate-binding protein [Actinomadura viridis]|uniref:Branched-chain amino acid transport system substrate-binding protein n=1 Tax=Actinomadura viridis TaxID=58110 RepID=A0A931DD30_9ACTN|nr:amino acid ABC transporter substrate-binding protein [Actinomadura viridis]MBG6086887.1 branched-chain amino acid transport system substrate-binding protein [Actinomadura viridis]